MTTTKVVETSVTVNNNSHIQDYVHLDDQTQPTFIIVSTCLTPLLKKRRISFNECFLLMCNKCFLFLVVKSCQELYAIDPEK